MGLPVTEAWPGASNGSATLRCKYISAHTRGDVLYRRRLEGLSTLYGRIQAWVRSSTQSQCRAMCDRWNSESMGALWGGETPVRPVVA